MRMFHHGMVTRELLHAHNFHASVGQFKSRRELSRLRHDVLGLAFRSMQMNLHFDPSGPPGHGMPIVAEFILGHAPTLGDFVRAIWRRL